MPSSSKKQHNFMEAIAHSPSFAKKVGVSQSVGKDFTTADKGRKFSKGGDMATMNPGFMAMMAKKKGMQEGSKADMAMDKKQMMGMKKGGFTPSSMGESHPDVGGGMKKGGMIKMANGGAFRASANGIATKGKTEGTMVKMANGGFVRAADGCAQRGKTKATQIKMNRGGMAC